MTSFRFRSVHRVQFLRRGNAGKAGYEATLYIYVHVDYVHASIIYGACKVDFIMRIDSHEKTWV